MVITRGKAEWGGRRGYEGTHYDGRRRRGGEHTIQYTDDDVL